LSRDLPKPAPRSNGCRRPSAARYRLADERAKKIVALQQRIADLEAKQ
jgi:hypothetical protein